MDCFLLNYPHKTNVRTPQEKESSQMTVGLLLAHLTQTDCTKQMTNDIRTTNLCISQQTKH